MVQTQRPTNDQKVILIVDDEPGVLKFLGTLLGDGNYHVLSAEGGAEALAQSKEYKGQIDLLLSDVQMPGINGVELATQISFMRPEIKVLLMSGFSGGMLVLNEGWHFLAKPFICSQLQALVVGLVSSNRPTLFAVEHPLV